MTLSPTATSSGTRLPLSSTRPGPIARTSPSCGFSLAVSGMTRPEAVVCSASRGRTTMRSSRGLMLTDTSDQPFSHETDVGDVQGERRRGGRTPLSHAGTLRGRVPGPNLALPLTECQTGPLCEDPRMDVATFDWLLTPEGSALLDVAAAAFADS